MSASHLQPERTAAAAFIEHKLTIDALITRLNDLAEAHFGADADHLDWGHVGTLTEVEKKLAEALDWAKGLSG